MLSKCLVGRFIPSPAAAKPSSVVQQGKSPSSIYFFSVFPAQCYAGVVYATAVCPSVCHKSKSCIKKAELIQLVWGTEATVSLSYRITECIEYKRSVFLHNQANRPKASSFSDGGTGGCRFVWQRLFLHVFPVHADERKQMIGSELTNQQPAISNGVIDTSGVFILAKNEARVYDFHLPTRFLLLPLRQVGWSNGLTLVCMLARITRKVTCRFSWNLGRR